MRWRKWFGRRRSGRIAPEDIFLDASNIPHFNTHQFEGRLERGISRKTCVGMLVFFIAVGGIFVSRLWYVQVVLGEEYRTLSDENTLAREIVFANRGIITDRNNTSLAWNESASTSEEVFPTRRYIEEGGFAHILGYLEYPKKDKAGFYFQEVGVGKGGVEGYYDNLLAGENGVRLVETDALGTEVSDAVVFPPHDGDPIVLSIDARITGALFDHIKQTVDERGFSGGTGVIMDVTNGEIIALTSFPEFSSAVMTDRSDVDAIQAYFEDEGNVFLNRAIGGLYAPGSTIKPFVAVEALESRVVSPEKTFYSSGALTLPNPYDPERPTIFKDWRAHGAVAMRDALAVSSNVYFYYIGGGFPSESVPGIGIGGIERVAEQFGLGTETGIDIAGETVGVIPSPAWKEEYFPGDPWRLGDTYHTAIGQYGFQVTPLALLRGVAAIANDGTLVTPHLYTEARFVGETQLSTIDQNIAVVQDGMRQAVTDGTASALSVPYVSVAAKTGTAEVGTLHEKVHSWVVGFFPFERPRYAFAVLMENGPVTNLVGGASVMRGLLDWMAQNTPEYFDVGGLPKSGEQVQ